jgi:hypothetical protein
MDSGFRFAGIKLRLVFTLEENKLLSLNSYYTFLNSGENLGKKNQIRNLL